MKSSDVSNIEFLTLPGYIEFLGLVVPWVQIPPRAAPCTKRVIQLAAVVLLRTYLVEKRGDWVATAIQDEENGRNVVCEIKQLSLPRHGPLERGGGGGGGGGGVTSKHQHQHIFLIIMQYP